MKSKKRCAMFCGVVVVLFMLVGSNLYAGTRGVTDDEILIGSHMDLSGPVSAWSIPAANSIRMRFDEVNAKGGIHGRKLKFIAEDTQYKVPLAIQKANKLINRDKVFLLLTSLGTSQCNAVFNQVQKKNNVPNFLPMSWAKAHVEPFHKLKFIGNAMYYDQTRAVTKYFVEEKNKKRVGLSYCETGYGEESAQGVIDQLKAMGMEPVITTTHSVAETNFIGEVNKLRGADCDVLMMMTITNDGLRMLKTVRDLGWDVDVVGGPGMASKKMSTLGGKSAEGMYLVSGMEMMYKEDATDPKAVAFFENYGKLYNDPDPGAIAQLGYTFVDITVLALEKAGKDLTVDSFIKAAESINGKDSYKSLFGGPDRSFGPNKHVATDEALLLWVKNGKFESPIQGKKIILRH